MLTLPDKVHPSLVECLPEGSRVLVAVSGGPDSQCLLDLIGHARHDLKLAEVWAVGIDHGLRPEAADELAHARDLATTHQIPFESIAVTLPTTGNLLEEARLARYQALEAFARNVDASLIAVAHTATDRAETVLINLARGCGLRGITSMHQRRGLIVRPLLGITRVEIEKYVEEHKINYALDPSNDVIERARARLRQQVHPALRAINPSFETNIVRFAELAEADESYLNTEAHAAAKLRQGPLKSLILREFHQIPSPIASRIIRYWLEGQQLPADHRTISELSSLIQRQKGRTSIGGRTVEVNSGSLWLESEGTYQLALPVPGRVDLTDFPLEITAAVQTRTNSTNKLIFHEKSAPTAVAFDADRLHLDLRVRCWRRGDKLRPFGLQGHTKLSDLFTDMKVPRPLRPKWPVVVSKDEIIWVAGLKRAAVAPLTEETTRVLQLEVLGLPGWSS